MIKISAPRSHPRFLSNLYRDILSDGVKKGITSLQGLTAHGRGEAFDYLIGEKTNNFARKAIEASCALLLLAKFPVISVNGNTAALVPNELIKLSEIIPAKLEINLFHRSKTRERKIADYIKKHGAGEILLPDKAIIYGVDSNRRRFSSLGQAKADVVLVPLEDGDRTQALIQMGKKVITIDLNPLSRTARTATVTIVDNIVRTIPLLTKKIIFMKKLPVRHLQEIKQNYDNRETLTASIRSINRHLTALAKKKRML